MRERNGNEGVWEEWRVRVEAETKGEWVSLGLRAVGVANGCGGGLGGRVEGWQGGRVLQAQEFGSVR